MRCDGLPGRTDGSSNRLSYVRGDINLEDLGNMPAVPSYTQTHTEQDSVSHNDSHPSVSSPHPSCLSSNTSRLKAYMVALLFIYFGFFKASEK